MVMQELIFRANDKCDVEMTNLSLQVRRLSCRPTKPEEINVFDQQKTELLQQIIDDADKTKRWGKQVELKLNENYKACAAKSDSLVRRKNELSNALMKNNKDNLSTFNKTKSH
ncbi:MAG: hypothetical protein ACOYOK_15000 [Pseudobdellovibrionaceae bacterium]